ncbi:DUF4332 domain-containing protein [Dysgonomonas sp. ZJ709]|uniref:DUF4332 domain-containing protein n=1 Tax=Dysgonomonas sp. ZJ709 TaxID=2709797 RepID=UPI0013EAFC8B|nr:DUF4332 domain-containing protein [Dysgonomonas sp. ZJ709]
MSYPIEQIEGVGAVYGEKLKAVGVTTTNDLLDKGATKKGRSDLAEKTGISESLILKWANHADLFRIKGVAGQFSELLEAAGIDTVKEFKHRVAENLHSKLEEVNASKKLTGRVPSVKELHDMIELAKGLEAKLTY